MKKLFLLIAAACVSLTAVADEGMWMLPYLQKMNIRDMKARGCKLSAEDIYSINKSSLKDAVVIFGGGCTGEIVSPDGLLFTNHHCGYGSIQSLSSVEHDYLKNGFWAMSRQEEIPAPGLEGAFHPFDQRRDCGYSGQRAFHGRAAGVRTDHLGEYRQPDRFAARRPTPAWWSRSSPSSKGTSILPL